MFNKRKKIREQSKKVRQNDEYSCKVEEYLINHGESFLEGFCELCERTQGRISYEEMSKILEKDFPVANWLPKENLQFQIVAFFQEIGVPVIADDTHFYFP